VDATQAYTWSGVPDDISNNIKVRVVDAINTNVYGDSLASFNIIGSITVQQPDASANWAVRANDKIITWLYTGSISDVNIYYDYGAGYQSLATGVSKGTGGSGSWPWPEIPDSVSNYVKV